MIIAKPTNYDRLAAKLANKVRNIAEAHGENRLRAAQGDQSRWRNPRLLWPNFTKG